MCVVVRFRRPTRKVRLTPDTNDYGRRSDSSRARFRDAHFEQTPLALQCKWEGLLRKSGVLFEDRDADDGTCQEEPSIMPAARRGYDALPLPHGTISRDLFPSRCAWDPYRKRNELATQRNSLGRSSGCWVAVTPTPRFPFSSSSALYHDTSALACRW